MTYFIHPLADVAIDDIGAETRIWQFVVICKNVRIGSQCNICSHVFIEDGVSIGNNVTIKSGAKLWRGVTVSDSVFIGPNVTFTNDKRPKSGNRAFSLLQTTVERNVSIGAGAVILPGITIGEGAIIGAGAVVTRSVEKNTTVVGNPAKPIQRATSASP
jgi:UDP-2-acetamido-3-amino-2,3-dideoxy-glucuronate N-acetyltransferase